MLALELGASKAFRRASWHERALACLEQVGAATLADRLPSKISGGQQQRIAIARALANDPPVLVADEPTGNLDSRSAHDVFDVLAGLTDHGKTVIFVTHATELRRAPRRASSCWTAASSTSTGRHRLPCSQRDPLSARAQGAA